MADLNITRPLPLFEKYGGMSKLRAVILDFYDRVLDDDDIGPFFEDIDMARLVDHQTKFMAMLLGGPVNFSEDRLERAHSRLGITHRHFDVAARLLSETLAAAGFDDVDRRTALNAVEVRRSMIVQGG